MAKQSTYKRPGPPPLIRTEEVRPWLVKAFPAALKASLKETARYHRMSLRDYVIMVFRDRLAAEGERS